MYWTPQGSVELINLGDEDSVTPARWTDFGRTIGLADPVSATYSEIFTTQRWVRSAIGFLADQAAECGYHVYRRLDDDSRVRLRPRDHPLAALLASPDPATFPIVTGFRLLYGFVADLLAFGNSYTVMLADPERSRQLRLQRLVAPLVVPEWNAGRLVLRYTNPETGSQSTFDLKDVIWMRTWDPVFPQGRSPIETLRFMLHEEYQSSIYRAQVWENGARMSGWISRPADVDEWEDTDKTNFLQDWHAAWARNGREAGGTPVLEDGMQYHSEQFNAEETQFLQGRELSREEVASVFHVPPTMLGQTRGSTYANTREHHTMLYQDVLGPIFAFIKAELEAQLLPALLAVDNEGVYVDPNIEEKLRGSFEDQARAAQTAVGRPFMSVNEMRAQRNLPRIDEDWADGIAQPLNMIVGGSAPEPRSLPAPPQRLLPPARPTPVSPTPVAPATRSAEEDAYRDQLAAGLAEFFRRQGANVASALGAGKQLSEAWDGDRWDRELAEDLVRRTLPIGQLSAQQILDKFGPDDLEWSDDPLIAGLSSNATGAARAINISTYELLVGAVLSGEGILDLVGDIFTAAEEERAPQAAQTQATFAASLGSSQAATVCGLRSKTWQVTSSNPRASHAALDGETVGINEVFSNGMRWPGDQSAGLDVGEYASCTCRVEYSAEEVP